MDKSVLIEDRPVLLLAYIGYSLTNIPDAQLSSLSRHSPQLPLAAPSDYYRKDHLDKYQ
jgi:hypothetical protein